MTQSISPEDAVRLRQVIMRLSRDLRRGSAAEGLAPAQSSTLATIVRAEDISLTELAVSEAINPTMLSRVINALEDQALILRAPDQDDKRTTIVKPTAKGRRVVERLRERRTQELVQRTELLDSAQLQTLIAALPAFETMARLDVTHE